MVKPEVFHKYKEIINNILKILKKLSPAISDPSAVIFAELEGGEVPDDTDLSLHRAV